MTKRVVNSKLALILFFLGFYFTGSAQVVYHSLDHKALYDFIDELAAQRLIEINSAIKPYSRKFIAQKLKEVQHKAGQLNARQKRDLAFYQKDFRKEWDESKDSTRLDLLYKRDSGFAFTLNPILGGTVWNVDGESFYHRMNGAELQGFVNNVGIHFRLADNHESLRISGPQYFTQRKGALYKSSNNEGADYSDMRGGLSYSWKWGSVGLIRDNMVWGNANNGENIFSDRAPTYTRFMLQMAPRDWIELNYSHGFLMSGVLDSSRSYNAGAHVRNVFVPKFVASNMLTIKAMKGLHVSAGNSVVYSDYVNPGFLIPFMFFKSVDHQSYYGGGNFGGQNSQMYFDISSRQLNKLHLYSTLFVDEIAFGRMWDEDQHSNFISFKKGLRYSNIFNQNISFIIEHTRTNAVVYRHFVNTTTFESNGYGLGHYLGDNSEELYLALVYRPISKLYTKLDFTRAQKGREHIYTGTNGTGLGLPHLNDVGWSLRQLRFQANYEVINDGYLNLSVSSTSSVYDKDVIPYDPSPLYLSPGGISISLGCAIGF